MIEAGDSNGVRSHVNGTNGKLKSEYDAVIKIPSEGIRGVVSSVLPEVCSIFRDNLLNSYTATLGYRRYIRK